MRIVKILIPSILSSLRLAAAVLFPLSPEHWWFWLIAIAGLSDVLDGWLARRWQAVTWQGAMIDAIADKVFVLTVLLVFISRGTVHLLWLPAVLCRDLLVLATAGIIALRRDWPTFKEMTARAAGKLATAGQFTLFLTVALYPDLSLPALCFCSICSTLAAVDYGRLFYTEYLVQKIDHD